MCMGGGSPPPAQQPAAAPPPPAEGPSAPVFNENDGDRVLLSSNRQGRRSLRIDRSTSVPGGGSGLTIPTA